jgi:hypothetical protein
MYVEHKEAGEHEQPYREICEEAKLLLKSAEMIEDRGWCQGNFEDKQGRMCLMGALKAAAPGMEAMGAYIRLRDYLGGSVMSWNDGTCQSQDEAVAKLRAAALGG